MSEYWKSTPKYWCKHCKTYVRDTKLEKANHDATPKHQGNLKRFLRDLHRGHEKDEKDKERAKAEVARLNGMICGEGSNSGAGPHSSSGFGRGSIPSIPKPQATPSQRKQQLAQLAEMGVSIPDEFRPDMAMAGEWQVTAQRVIETDVGEKKPEAIALGVRKRQVEDEEEEPQKRRWGNTYRTHPTGQDDSDLDALLSKATQKTPQLPKVDDKVDVKEEFKEELAGDKVPGDVPSMLLSGGDTAKFPGLKEEPSDGENILTFPPADLKQEGAEQSAGIPGIVFKKRKAKNIRQR